MRPHFDGVVVRPATGVVVNPIELHLAWRRNNDNPALTALIAAILPPARDIADWPGQVRVISSISCSTWPSLLIALAGRPTTKRTGWSWASDRGLAGNRPRWPRKSWAYCPVTRGPVPSSGHL
ncbi:hypothetical protein [Streptomyces sp. NBC_01235]|uniref:hypothetical protein n=1 Tax=Streptomyces sp. NBC_01235 TaxID=2903788 RepID=UPI002E114099|nr:hypothetical protein OG289_09370 [Streptomyces sp. NBC_01235]